MQISPITLISSCAATAKTAVLAVNLFAFTVVGHAATNQDELDFIAAQIQRAEADQASASLQQIIEQIEGAQGRYAADLTNL